MSAEDSPHEVPLGTRVLVRCMAVLILVFAFGSYGLARHGHEPFPTGRFPGFDNSPVVDGAVTTRAFVVESTNSAGTLVEHPIEMLFPDTETSLRQITQARLNARLDAPSSGLAALTWDLVGPGSALRRNQPLDYVTADGTSATFADRIEDLTGTRPVSIRVFEQIGTVEAESGDLLEERRVLVATICEVCP